MAAEKWVVVEHRDGREYGVLTTDPRATGEEPGWKVVREIDNSTPYVAPKETKSESSKKDAE